MKRSLVLWNVVLYLYCLIFAVLFVQHQMFYNFPPSGQWNNVSLPTYFFVGLVVMGGYKIANYAADRGEFIEDGEYARSIKKEE